MKKFGYQFFFLMLVGSTVFANGLRPVIEVTTYGGMPMPNLAPRGVRIMSNGAILKVTGAKTQEVGRLTLQKTTEITKAVANLDGELVDLNEGTPFCADAPVTDYIATRENLEPLVIGQLKDCHTYQLDGGSYDSSARARNLVRLLEGLNNL